MIVKEMRTLMIKGHLRYVGSVPHDKLACLYAAARLFVYPSLYEGFGLPPLEAMASGTPTVVSNRASLPEVAGAAATLIDRDDVEAPARALSRTSREILPGGWFAAATERDLVKSG